MSLKGSAKGKVLRGSINKLYELRGYSAYEIAVIHGFEGTEEEWLASECKGEKGDPGNDYILTESDKTEIANTVLASLPEWTGGSY